MTSQGKNGRINKILNNYFTIQDVPEMVFNPDWIRNWKITPVYPILKNSMDDSSTELLEIIFNKTVLKLLFFLLYLYFSLRSLKIILLAIFIHLNIYKKSMLIQMEGIQLCFMVCYLMRFLYRIQWLNTSPIALPIILGGQSLQESFISLVELLWHQ